MPKKQPCLVLVKYLSPIKIKDIKVLMVLVSTALFFTSPAWCVEVKYETDFIKIALRDQVVQSELDRIEEELKQMPEDKSPLSDTSYVESQSDSTVAPSLEKSDSFDNQKKLSSPKDKTEMIQQELDIMEKKQKETKRREKNAYDYY